MSRPPLSYSVWQWKISFKITVFVTCTSSQNQIKMTCDQSIASKVKQEFTQIYLILVQALNVIKSEKREIWAECHKNVQWELEPKYYFNRHEDPLIGLPDWLCPNPQVRVCISRRIMMVYDTLYFLESALIKFQKPAITRQSSTNLWQKVFWI